MKWLGAQAWRRLGRQTPEGKLQSSWEDSLAVIPKTQEIKLSGLGHPQLWLLPQSSLGSEKRKLGQPLCAQNQKEPSLQGCIRLIHLSSPQIKKEKEHLSSGFSFLNMSTHFHSILSANCPSDLLAQHQVTWPLKLSLASVVRLLTGQVPHIHPWSRRGGFHRSNFPPDPEVECSHSVMLLSSSQPLSSRSQGPHFPEASSSLTSQPILIQVMTIPPLGFENTALSCSLPLSLANSSVSFAVSSSLQLQNDAQS